MAVLSVVRGVWVHRQCLRQSQGPLPSRQQCALHAYDGSGPKIGECQRSANWCLEAATCMC